MIYDRDAEAHKEAIREGRVATVHGTGAHRIINGKRFSNLEVFDWCHVTKIGVRRVYNFNGEWHYVFKDSIDKALFLMAFS